MSPWPLLPWSLLTCSARRNEDEEGNVLGGSSGEGLWDLEGEGEESKYVDRSQMELLW
jgi:hypothetical protein